MQPNKDLGQHWLNHQPSLQAVIDSIAIKPDDIVVEIGPGLGSLTKLLVEQAQRVVAVEFDENLARQLPAKVQDESLEVVNEDIRTFNFTTVDSPYKVVGNIPYYLTSHLVQLLLELPNPPVAIGLIVQKEVAERLAAKPGELSVLGVTTQLLSEVELGELVPAELFTPPPKVDSQVVSMRPKSHQSDVDQIIKVVKAGFSQRRKQLKNSLAATLHVDKDQVSQVLDELTIDNKIRPQSLTLEQWRQLTDELKNHGYVSA